MIIAAYTEIKTTLNGVKMLKVAIRKRTRIKVDWNRLLLYNKLILMI